MCICACVRVRVRVLTPMHLLSSGIHSTSFVEEYSIYVAEVLTKYCGVLRVLNILELQGLSPVPETA
jgi:hypothetical protein